MKITLHPAAERDLFDAAAFYEREGSTVLAARFVHEFKRLTALVAQTPEIGLPRSRGRRGLSMRVFPYTLIYKALGDELEILVVKHDRRSPGYGRSRS